VWWDPHALILEAPSVGGLRRDDLIAKDGDQAGMERRMGEYRSWQADRTAAVARASIPTIVSATATGLAGDRALPDAGDVDIQVVDLPRPVGRPFGPRFGSLVHATLATVPLDAAAADVLRVARTQARLLVADDAEAVAAAEAVSRALAQPLFERVRSADAAGLAWRECPILWRAPDGALVEGTADVVFGERGDLIVLDFKTDRDPSEFADQYKRQLALYCRAFAALRRKTVRGILVKL
jgi:ATP-dependent exoDNAse (exonuclease V) beta subunit